MHSICLFGNMLKGRLQIEIAPSLHREHRLTKFENSAVDLVVVGAGPIGLIAALCFERVGHRVALVGPDAPRDGRTTAILNDGVALLQRIGAWDLLQEKAAPLQTMRIVDGTRRLIRAPEARFDAQELALSAFGYNVQNADLLEVLSKAVTSKPDIMRVKKQIVGCAFHESGNAELSIEGGDVLNAPFVIAADGRNSVIRESAEIETKRWRYPQTALVMNLTHTRHHDFVSTEFHTETGPFTLVPLPGKRSSLVWVEKPALAEEMLGWSLEKLSLQVAERSHYLLGDVTVEDKPMAYPLSGLTANTFGKRNVVLVGESAHVFPPIGAQGMNLGMRDIAALERIMKKNQFKDADPYDVAALYANARRMDVSLRTRAVDALNRSLLTDFLPVHLGRGLGLYALNAMPVLRKFIMQQGLGARAKTH